MKKNTKIWLIVATSLILIGCVIFGSVMTVCKGDFMKLETTNLQTNTYDINEGYKNISIVADTADIMIVPSKDKKHSIVCYEKKNLRHTVSVENETLTIQLDDTRKWYEYIGINFSTPKIELHIPESEYGSLLIKSNTSDIEIPQKYKFNNVDIDNNTGHVRLNASTSELAKVKTSTGNISVGNNTVGALEFSVSTGEILVSKVQCKDDMNIKVSTGKVGIVNCNCKNLTTNASTGNITLETVIAKNKMSITTSTGGVKFAGSDAAEIFVETDTGDVKGTLLTEKVFFAQTDTGRVALPKTTNGGKCEITTNTGDIKISIED